MNVKYFFKIFLPVFVGVLICWLPHPQSIDPKGWNLLGIFIATIIGLMLRPLPMGPVALSGLAIATLTNSLEIQESLSGLGSPTIWLIIFVFFIARGFTKTYLGSRIAYTFIRLIGQKTLGIGYGIALTELLIAPLIPSNSARSGGIVFPIARSISEALGSYPNDPSRNRIGNFLTQICFQSNIISSAMFLTAMAANPLAQAIAAKQGVSITWMNWFLAASVPGLISILVIPLFIYYFSPPDLKDLPQAVTIAKEKLHQMGPITIQEWVMVSVFSLMLVLWIFGGHFSINACTVALLGFILLLITKVIDWKDVLNEHEAWHTLIWLSTLVTMSTFLEKYGLMLYFSQSISSLVTGFSPLLAFLVLALIYFYSHYFFASNTAHVSSMYGPFLGVSIAAGAPPLLCALVLGFFNSLFSSMTHYGTSPAPILYGAGYVSFKTWWTAGFIVSIINLLIWLVGGGLWWKVLGIW